LREGLGEVVKHGIIEGDDVFEALETLAPHPLRKWPWETVVADSLRIKAMIVADDKHEAGAREILNLGHTFGHAIERVTNYRTTHGDAVSMGLRAAGLLALRTGRFSQSEHLRVISLLTLLRLPLVAPTGDVDALLAAMASDKKTRAGTLRFVLPRTIGDVEYGVTVPARSIRTVLGRLSSPPGAAEVR
jgi:3-dehydroquinate synthetase